VTAPRQPATLVLLGLRGSGKSTLGHTLAKRLERAFVDLDDLTAEAMQQTSAGEAIREHGLAVFREAEARALADALTHERAHRSGGVLALGGGTPTAPGAEQQLREAQSAGAVSVVYLRATPQTLAARLATTDTESRPSLTGKGTLEEIGELFTQRDSLYRAIADVVLETDELDESATLDRLVIWARSIDRSIDRSVD
jgi:shikimate kinase